MLSSNFSNSVEIELEKMIEKSLIFNKNSTFNFLYTDIKDFLSLNIRNFKNKNLFIDRPNQIEAKQILLNTLEDYNKNKQKIIYIIDILKDNFETSITSKRFELFKTIIQDEIRNDCNLLGRGKKTKRRKIKKNQTKRKKPKKPRKKKN